MHRMNRKDRRHPGRWPESAGHSFQDLPQQQRVSNVQKQVDEMMADGIALMLFKSWPSTVCPNRLGPNNSQL